MQALRRACGDEEGTLVNRSAPCFRLSAGVRRVDRCRLLDPAASDSHGESAQGATNGEPGWSLAFSRPQATWRCPSRHTASTVHVRLPGRAQRVRVGRTWRRGTRRSLGVGVLLKHPEERHRTIRAGRAIASFRRCVEPRFPGASRRRSHEFCRVSPRPRSEYRRRMRRCEPLTDGAPSRSQSRHHHRHRDRTCRRRRATEVACAATPAGAREVAAAGDAAQAGPTHAQPPRRPILEVLTSRLGPRPSGRAWPSRWSVQRSRRERRAVSIASTSTSDLLAFRSSGDADERCSDIEFAVHRAAAASQPSASWALLVRGWHAAQSSDGPLRLQRCPSGQPSI